VGQIADFPKDREGSDERRHENGPGPETLEPFVYRNEIPPSLPHSGAIFDASVDVTVDVTESRWGFHSPLLTPFLSQPINCRSVVAMSNRFLPGRVSVEGLISRNCNGKRQGVG
jgi:hypothetical protein